MLLLSTIVIIPDCLCGHTKCALHKAYLGTIYKEYASMCTSPQMVSYVHYHLNVISSKLVIIVSFWHQMHAAVTVASYVTLTHILQPPQVSQVSPSRVANLAGTHH